MNVKALILGLVLGAVCAAAASPGNSIPQNPSVDAGYTPIPLRESYTTFPFPRRLPDIDGVHALKDSFVNIDLGDYAGAGVIIEKGMVLTNAHVVIDEDGDLRKRRVQISLYDGRRVSGYYIAHSRTYDIAILRIPEDFGTPAPLANSEVPLEQEVIAIGNPARGKWVAKGRVLALGLRVRHTFVPDRTDAAIRMFVMNAAIVAGYSGGPVVHPLTGEVYGISVGLAERYIDPATGLWVTPPARVGLAMHIHEVLAEVEALRTPPLIAKT